MLQQKFVDGTELWQKFWWWHRNPWVGTQWLREGRGTKTLPWRRPVFRKKRLREVRRHQENAELQDRSSQKGKVGRRARCLQRGQYSSDGGEAVALLTGQLWGLCCYRFSKKNGSGEGSREFILLFPEKLGTWGRHNKLKQKQGGWEVFVFQNSKNVHMFLANGGGAGLVMCERR